MLSLILSLVGVVLTIQPEFIFPKTTVNHNTTDINISVTIQPELIFIKSTGNETVKTLTKYHNSFDELINVQNFSQTQNSTGKLDKIKATIAESNKDLLENHRGNKIMEQSGKRTVQESESKSKYQNPFVGMYLP